MAVVSLPKPDLHIRLSEEAEAALALAAEYEGRPKAELAGQLLETTLLGHVHAIRVILRKARRLGFAGRSGDEEDGS